MALKHLPIAALLLTLSLPLFSPSLVNASSMQRVVAATWQPVARIDPQKNYRVQLTNQAGIVVEYASTSNEFPPRKLQPNQSTTITQLPLPIYLLISPVSPRFNLKYSVSAANNIVQVKIQRLPEKVPGNTTINIQESGGIFVY